MTTENPTIVVPGIKGSSLENFYALEPENMWSAGNAFTSQVFGRAFTDLALDPSGTSDFAPRVTTRANGLLPVAYERLVNALRQRRQLPVYVFPYDWRYSVEKTAEKLGEFTAAIHRKITAEAPVGWSGKIDFVCHSMGGLVFRALLGKYAKKEHIGRVVFLAVPHRGSLDAVDAMIRGNTILFGGMKEMRKLARTFPGVYELLPRFKDALVDGAGNALSPFDVKNWQANVTPHGAAGVEVHGCDVEQHHLDDAEKVLKGLIDPVAAGLDPKETLTIYGARENSTLLRIPVGPAPARDYDFGNAVKCDGDGVVPAHSALLKGMPAVKLTWDDVSYFTETTAALNFHAFIGTLDETQAIVARFLAGATLPGDILPRGLPTTRYEPSPNPPL